MSFAIMPEFQTARLADRSILRLSGSDAETLLQNVVTNDIAMLGNAKALHTALLTPQGKIICDFFVVRDGDDFLIDVAGSELKNLLARLTMYKLRSDVEITDASEALAVKAIWGGVGKEPTEDYAIVFVDPRLADLGFRAIVPVAKPATSSGNSDAVAYHAHRIAHGVPEGGKDFIFGDTFPHEALFDQLCGVSFTKGCYIGQEVVSRMHHRGSARKRIVNVTSLEDVHLPNAETEIAAGPAKIGKMGSSSANNGLALIRLDRAQEAMTAGTPIQTDDITLKVFIQPWAKFTFENPSGITDGSASA